MDRRTFAAGMAATLATPLTSYAQDGRRHRRTIGYLGNAAPPASAWNAFLAELSEYGFIEDKNLLIEARYAKAAG